MFWILVSAEFYSSSEWTFGTSAVWAIRVFDLIWSQSIGSFVLAIVPVWKRFVKKWKYHNCNRKLGAFRIKIKFISFSNCLFGFSVYYLFVYLVFLYIIWFFCILSCTRHKDQNVCTGMESISAFMLPSLDDPDPVMYSKIMKTMLSL